MTSTSAALDRPPADIVRNPRLFNAMLLVIVFVGGVCSVAIELSAARLLGPFFGTSDIIWANLIGLTLLYLSVGYFVGGKIADRWPSATLLYVFTALAGFATGLIPLIAHPILEGSLIAFEHLAVGAFYGSLVGVLLLFAIPVTMLGFVSPFAIRLRVNSVSSAGNTAGSLYALSTVGSILGSFLPVLILIPTIGTYQTFYTLSITLLVASALALFALHARVHAGGAVALALIVFLAARFWTSTIVRPPQIGKLIYQTESQYNYIQVVKQGNTTMLMLDDGHAVHSIYNPTTEITGGPWDYFMVAPFFNPNETPQDVHNVALIGLAAGTIARQMTTGFGPIPIDGVEIDPNIVKVGREYFDMTEPNLNVIVQDGRYFLETTNKHYDEIGIDAYQQPYIPFHLTTEQFFQQVRDHLTPNGVAVVNAGRTSTDYRLVDVIANTMKAVFPNVYIIDVDRYTNSIVIGTNQPTNIANFTQNINRLSPGIIHTVGETSLQSGNIREWTTLDPSQVFTDNWSPIERVIDSMIVDAARGQ